MTDRERSGGDTARSTRSVKGGKSGRGSRTAAVEGPSPSDMLARLDIRRPRGQRPSRSRAGAPPAAGDAALLAPPDPLTLALAREGFTSKLEPRALEAAQHASKLQAELTALLHAADEAAAAANTKLVIQRAEAAAAEKRHAEALEAHQAEMEGARARLPALEAEVAKARDESAGLRRELAAKEDEYALELQRWVVDLSASHSQKVVDAVAAERDKASREEQRREKALRDEYEARIRGLEEQLAAAERGGGRDSGPRAGDQFVNAADPQQWDC